MAGLAGLSFGELAEKTRLLTPVYAQTSGSALLICDTNDGGTGTTQLVSNTGANNPPPLAPEAGTMRLENDLSVTDLTSPTPIVLVGYASAVEGFTSSTEINGGIGVWGQSDSAAGVRLYGHASATSGSNYGVIGFSDSNGGVGVRGVAKASGGSTIGVDGRSESVNGTGVRGLATAGSGSVQGVYGQSNSPSGVGVLAVAGIAGTKPIIAQGATGQTANLQEWQNSSGSTLSAVDANGKLGIGTAAPQYGLHVITGTVGPLTAASHPPSSAPNSFICQNLSSGNAKSQFTFRDSTGANRYSFGNDQSGNGSQDFFIYDEKAAKFPLTIDSSGHVHLLDLVFANGYRLKEDRPSLDSHSGRVSGALSIFRSVTFFVF